MPAKHDYVCNNCGLFMGDQYVRPLCTRCEQDGMEITYEHWTHGLSHTNDELCDDKGRRKAFNCKDDPLVSIELGLAPDPRNGTKAIPHEVSMALAEKMIKCGDSPKMRNEVLETRKQYV